MRLRTTNRRGLSLLTVMLVVAVVTILVAAAVAFTGRELSSAAQQKRRERMGACAAAARNWVVSQIRLGAGTTSIRGEFQSGDFMIGGGHLDDDGGNVNSFTAASSCPVDQLGDRMIDLTNTTPGPGASAGCVHYIAHCRDTKLGDSTEVEGEIYLAPL